MLSIILAVFRVPSRIALGYDPLSPSLPIGPGPQSPADSNLESVLRLWPLKIFESNRLEANFPGLFT